MENEKHYAVERKPDGSLLIRLANGEELKQDPNYPPYCDFLSWESKQNPHSDPEFDRLDPGHYVAEERAFVDYCKSRGVTVYIQRDKGEPQIETGRHFVLRQGGDARFYAVARSVASDGSVGDGIEPRGEPIYVGAKLLAALNAKLKDEESDIRCLSSWPVERAFVYFDISDFSQFAPGQQVLVINALISIAGEEAYWAPVGDEERSIYRSQQNRESSLCIGDGYIFVFKDSGDATIFAAYLAQLIETIRAQRELPVAFHFRAGVHVGPVYRFWDPGRSGWNYIGDGINGGQRVLGAVGKETDDVVFISGEVRERIAATRGSGDPFGSMLSNMQNRGRRKDKHGKPWRVYELNHTALTEGRVSLAVRLLYGGTSNG